MGNNILLAILSAQSTCKLTRAAVGMGIPTGIPMGMGMGWVWGLKFNPHGSPEVNVERLKSPATINNLAVRVSKHQIYPEHRHKLTADLTYQRMASKHSQTSNYQL